MFSNVSKYCLWDLTPDYIKELDRETTQLFYEGENRGQTQRFMITAGDLILELFQIIERLSKCKDCYELETDFLQYLQRELGANFLVADNNEKEKLIREILSEIFCAWRLKGTESFLHWIIWKVFGWNLLNILTMSSIALILSVGTSFLYDDELPYEQQKLLYDPDYMTPDDKATLIIDVFGDVNFSDKKKTLEILLRDWTVYTNIQYFNTP